MPMDAEYIIPVIRGLLARPSGNEDDRYVRAAVSFENAVATADVWLDIPNEEMPPDALRDMLRDAVHAAGSGTLAVDGLGILRRVTDIPPGELSGKIALVTGAAGAIGAGICRALHQAGCFVAAADIAAEGVAALARELDATGNTAMPVIMDVTDKDAVTRAFGHPIRKWGGVDIVIVNAGIAMVSALTEIEPEAYRRIQKVNEDGALLTLAEAARCFKRQATGGDIVLISTKNVFMPGAQFGAYSATKAAAHQLARIASQELAAFDIRVNMVAPDAVFGEADRKSGLWAEVGPSRMKARGLDEEGLETYYRDRNLLKARVTSRHVANAVLFFVTRKTPTTGATIPVDGGLPDSTPR